MHPSRSRFAAFPPSFCSALQKTYAACAAKSRVPNGYQTRLENVILRWPVVPEEIPGNPGQMQRNRGIPVNIFTNLIFIADPSLEDPPQNQVPPTSFALFLKWTRFLSKKKVGTTFHILLITCNAYELVALRAPSRNSRHSFQASVPHCRKHTMQNDRS